MQQGACLEAKEKSTFDVPPSAMQSTTSSGDDSSTKTNKQILIWCSAGAAGHGQGEKKERKSEATRSHLFQGCAR